MHEISTWGMVAELAGGITLWSILSYFWLSAEALNILTTLLAIDIIFWLLDSYFVTKNTSSKKLVEWLARKFWRWVLPFVTILALKWIGYEWTWMMADIVMWVLILSEWYSILWHIYALNYWESLPEIDALKLLIKKISDLFKWIISKKTPDEQDWGSLQ